MSQNDHSHLDFEAKIPNVARGVGLPADGELQQLKEEYKERQDLHRFIITTVIGIVAAVASIVAATASILTYLAQVGTR